MCKTQPKNIFLSLLFVSRQWSPVGFGCLWCWKRPSPAESSIDVSLWSVWFIIAMALHVSASALKKFSWCQLIHLTFCLRKMVRKAMSSQAFGADNPMYTTRIGGGSDSWRLSVGTDVPAHRIICSVFEELHFANYISYLIEEIPIKNTRIKPRTRLMVAQLPNPKKVFRWPSDQHSASICQFCLATLWISH